MNRDGHLLFSDDIYEKISRGDISMEDGLDYCPSSRLQLLKEKIGNEDDEDYKDE